MRGEYGTTPAPIDPAFRKRIIGDEPPIDCPSRRSAQARAGYFARGDQRVHRAGGGCFVLCAVRPGCGEILRIRKAEKNKPAEAAPAPAPTSDGAQNLNIIVENSGSLKNIKRELRLSFFCRKACKIFIILKNIMQDGPRILILTTENSIIILIEVMILTSNKDLLAKIHVDDEWIFKGAKTHCAVHFE